MPDGDGSGVEGVGCGSSTRGLLHHAPAFGPYGFGLAPCGKEFHGLLQPAGSRPDEGMAQGRAFGLPDGRVREAGGLGPRGIEENFYQEDTQKGIFTLSSENKEAEEKIEKTTKKIKELNLELKNEEKNTGFKFDLEKKQTEINDL